MANNPVQIVLNNEAFITAPEKGGFGSPSDFFAGRDSEFRNHKKHIRKGLETVRDALKESSFGNVGYARVLLREEALAKSHRPVRTLFRPQSATAVGAGALGEIYYRVSAENVDGMIDVVDSAEEETNWQTDPTGKKVAVASRQRADVGVIESIELPEPGSKRNFDIRQALQWMSSPLTDGRYVVELFEPIPEQITPSDPRYRLFGSLKSLLQQLGMAVDARFPRFSNGRTELVSVRVQSAKSGARLASAEGRSRKELPAPLDLNPERHSAVLDLIASHPLVRKISLPLKLRLAHNAANGRVSQLAYKVTDRLADGRYPKVGVVDAGIADCLAGWVEDRSDFLDSDDLDPDHGTKVAGLLVDARQLNGADIGREADGCVLYDIPLYSTNLFEKYFQRRGFDELLDQLDIEVGEMVERHGVRIFNMSITAESLVEPERYSRFAMRLDEIQRRHDVLFVLSVGNLEVHERRSPWPSKPGAVVDYFAARTAKDGISQPSESVYAVSVGAINPSGLKGHIEGAPTTYTCRGPGLRVGCKPDVVHFGGALPRDGNGKSGLTTLGSDGMTVDDAGTSFAAPLVAKTLASIDAKLEDRLPTHALHALLVHHSTIPDTIAKPRLHELARQFCGFGLPQSSETMLITDDSAITLVFNSAIPRGSSGKAQILRFGFSWPTPLVRPDGACVGQARMTLVYRPPLDPNFGTEFVRVNLDAKLQQRQVQITRKDGNASYRNEIGQAFLPKTAGQGARERELIKHGLKWWPVKKYACDFSGGVGETSDWRVEVDSVTRAEAVFPEEVPFTLVLTISDPEGRRAIFQEMRRTLQARNVQLQDLQASTRIRPRSR